MYGLSAEVLGARCPDELPVESVPGITFCRSGHESTDHAAAGHYVLLEPDADQSDGFVPGAGQSDGLLVHDNQSTVDKLGCHGLRQIRG